MEDTQEKQRCGVTAATQEKYVVPHKVAFLFQIYA